MSPPNHPLVDSWKHCAIRKSLKTVDWKLSTNGHIIFQKNLQIGQSITTIRTLFVLDVNIPQLQTILISKSWSWFQRETNKRKMSINEKETWNLSERCVNSTHIILPTRVRIYLPVLRTQKGWRRYVFNLIRLHLSWSSTPAFLF